MNTLKRITSFLIILYPLIIDVTTEAQELLWPICRPQRITGTFCEPRGIRFHYGLDISCNGEKGYKIYAVDDGYISAVMYQKLGIGYAIMVTHKDGRRSMYGHMSRFAEFILNNEQIAAHSKDILDRVDFRVDFKKPAIPVNRGYVIGFSGDSGIGSEHLHFEIRNSDNVNLNPLRSGIKVKDNSAPVFARLHIVPLDGYSSVVGECAEKIYNLREQGGKDETYALPKKIKPVVAGRIGLMVKTYDLVGYRRGVAIYKLELFVNDQKLYEVAFDSMPRDFDHHLGLFYNYDYSTSAKYTYYLYSKITGDGCIDTNKYEKSINIKINAYDANMNKSVFEAKFKKGEIFARPICSPVLNLFRNKALNLKSADGLCDLSFDKKSAFYNESVSFSADARIKAPGRGLEVKSNLYKISPTSLCINVPANLSIQYDGDDYKKVGVYAMHNKHNDLNFVSNRYNLKEKRFDASIYQMGAYLLLRDDIPPKIRYRVKRIVNTGHSFKFYVSDSGSGVDLQNVNLKVDDKNVVYDFDMDYNFIEILTHNEIWQKGVHEIKLQIQDMAGNKSPVVVHKYEVR